MSATVLEPGRPVVDQLRERVTAMQGGPTRLPVPTHPAVADLLQLRTGGSYGVDSASLALALAAGASATGEWVGFAGWPDFGAEAAASLGIDLSRTVLVPDPGESWLEIAAALVDVLRVVVLRPTVAVDARSAGVLDARLRSRASVLVVWGQWPRVEARLSLEQARWTGPQDGHARLQERRANLTVRRGTAPPVRSPVRFPGRGAALERIEPEALAGLAQRRESSG